MGTRQPRALQGFARAGRVNGRVNASQISLLRDWRRSQLAGEERSRLAAHLVWLDDQRAALRAEACRIFETVRGARPPC